MNREQEIRIKKITALIENKMCWIADLQRMAGQGDKTAKTVLNIESKLILEWFQLWENLEKDPSYMAGNMG